MYARQQGLSTIEFAIVSAVMMLVTFGVIEVGRLMFTYNVLNESTRRAARVAAVCFPNGATLTRVQTLATFANIPNLTSANVELTYRDAAGATVATPAANFAQIRYVRVRIVNFTYQMYIPFMSSVLTPPDFAVTLPRESLGVPRQGAIQPC